MNRQPIGVFDSGVGGLSVWKELVKQLPHENVVYLADDANCPYGPKTTEEIKSLCEKNVAFLQTQNCKMIVLACNTATGAAIAQLRKKFQLPFIGTEPAAKPAATKTATNHIGLLATKSSLKSKVFDETISKYASHVNVHKQEGENWVRLVEQGLMNTIRAEKAVENSLHPLLEYPIDQLILGCTHYPFLINSIKKVIANKNINIINPAPAIAAQVGKVLGNNSLLNDSGKKPRYQFYASGNGKSLARMLKYLGYSESVIREQLSVVSN